MKCHENEMTRILTFIWDEVVGLCGHESFASSCLASSVGLRWNNDAAVPGVSYATAAQPQKQQGKCVKPGLPDISELSPHLQQE